jgi:hypothetical protein
MVEVWTFHQRKARRLRLIFVVLPLLAVVTPVAGADWIAAPSRYTHEPQTGHRVWQYAPILPVPHQPMYGRSAYRQARSSLQVGNSIDQFHVVEEYGHPVRPYGEWRFPFRPFSVPYDLWGPAPGVVPGFGYGYGYGPGAGGVGSPYGPFGAVNGAGFPPPWNDGSYPDVRRRQLPPRPFNLNSPTLNNTNINGDGNTTNLPTNNVSGIGNEVNN